MHKRSWKISREGGWTKCPRGNGQEVRGRNGNGTINLWPIGIENLGLTWLVNAPHIFGHIFLTFHGVQNCIPFLPWNYSYAVVFGVLEKLYFPAINFL
jgi:hypothetical protein